jgi:hypothetical protein
MFVTCINMTLCSLLCPTWHTAWQDKVRLADRMPPVKKFSPFLDAARHFINFPARSQPCGALTETETSYNGEISGFHIDENENNCLLTCCAMSSATS